ncbi:hypothetical protein T03_13225 [Trichinella britovi]|uniref:Uncharacterized protein n=1 Tax=Trichinella britovi TaxID=45882 RepID=A0A0V1CYB1_TRIBR|nr:hypothetical protein T03_13225 [Trichinella britovi]
MNIGSTARPNTTLHALHDMLSRILQQFMGDRQGAERTSSRMISAVEVWRTRKQTGIGRGRILSWYATLNWSWRGAGRACRYQGEMEAVVTDREKTGICGRVFGVSIGGGVHNSRYLLEGRERRFHSDCTDGRPDRIRQRKYCGRSGQRDWRWGSQHCVGGGWIGNGTQTVIRQWKYVGQQWMQSQEGTSLRMSVGWTARPYTTRNALWNDCSAALAVGFTSLGTYWRGVGGDSFLIVRWEYGRQCFNTELLLEECGSGLPLLVRVGWSSRKRHDYRHGRPNDWYKDRRWDSQHWVGSGGIGNGVQTVIRWWTYIEQQCQEGTSLRMIVGWADWPFTTINALWDEWSAGGIEIGNRVQTVIRRWKYIRQGVMKAVVRRSIIESVGWAARPYTTRNALWNDCSAALAVGFTSLGTYWRGVGGDSFLIVRWEYGRQCFNTELLLEECGSGLPLLVRVGWSSRKRHDYRHGRPNDWYKDRRWDSQHWVGSGGIGNGVQTVIRWWTYIEQQCQEGTSLRMIVGWADWPFTTINALWDEWSAGGIEIGNRVQTVIRRWKYIRQGVMKAVVRRSIIESVGWAARPYTTRNALWNDCSAALAVGFTSLGTYWRGVGGDSFLIVRWEYGRQCFNTELLLEECGSGLPLLVRVGWSSRKRHDYRHGRPNDWYKDRRWDSQHWVGSGGIGNGVQSVSRWWTYIEQAGDTSINALWEEWSARIQQLGGDGLGEGRGVGEDSKLIIRGKCFEQVYNTKLPLEVCGSGVYLLQSDGCPNMKRIHCDRFWLGGKIVWHPKGIVGQVVCGCTTIDRLAVRFTSLSMCQRRLGGDSTLIKRWKYCEQRGLSRDSTLIIRWKYGEQVCNTELLLERCRSGVSLLLPDGWGSRIWTLLILTEWEREGIEGIIIGVCIGYVVHKTGRWKYGEQVQNPELLLEGSAEGIPLLGSNVWSGKKEREGISARMIGVRICDAVHNYE